VGTLLGDDSEETFHEFHLSLNVIFAHLIDLAFPAEESFGSPGIIFLPEFLPEVWIRHNSSFQILSTGE
jgi:hypothetical protein